MEAVKKPIPVIIFGVLNIVFGGFGLLFSSLVIFRLTASGETAGTSSTYKIWLLFMNTVGFGFSIWLSILGIGLLKLKNWARRGSVIYACLGILLSVIETGVNFLAIFLHWVTIPQGGLSAYLVGMCIGFVGGLIYPVLLLIFMQTANIRQAFQNPTSQ
jgi:hypothetical protein